MATTVYVVPIIALVVSGITCWRDEVHHRQAMEGDQRAMGFAEMQYEELTKPHTLHEEIYDELGILYKKAERSAVCLARGPAKGDPDLQDAYRKGQRRMSDAETALHDREYSDAQEFIKEADSYFSVILESSYPIEVNVTITAWSPDGYLWIQIDNETIAKTKEGDLLSAVTIVVALEWPSIEPPNNIMLVYDILPDGATFTRPILLTFSYNPDSIPEGFLDEDLTIATWDESGAKWSMLKGCKVNARDHTITAPVTHLTLFAVVAQPPALTVPLSWRVWLFVGIAVIVVLTLGVAVVGRRPEATE